EGVLKGPARGPGGEAHSVMVRGRKEIQDLPDSGAAGEPDRLVADAESLTTLRLSLDLAGLGAVLPGLLTRLRATLPTRPPGRGQDPAAPRVLLDRAGRPVADPQPRLPRPHLGRRPAGPPRSRATQRPRVAV